MCQDRARHGLKQPLTENWPAAGFAVSHRDPRVRMRVAHTHANIELNYLQTGRLDYLYGGVRRTVEAGRLAAFWAGVPHQTLTSAGKSDGIWVHLPLAWVLQWKLPRDMSGRLLAGEFFEFELSTETPERWLHYFRANAPEETSVLLLDMHATLAALALRLPPAAPSTLLSHPAGLAGGEQHIARMTAFIAAHYHENDLTIEDIARVVNLRANYLTTLFKRHCHIGLWEYVTRLRISHAQRLLATTDLRVLDVALESGFCSLAPFYHAFSRYCGMQPVAFRKQQQTFGWE